MLAFVEEHVEDVPGAVITEQLAMFALVVGNAVAFDHCNKIPLRETTQGGFAEMRIVRQEVVGLDLVIGKITAPTPGHQDFLAGLVGMIDDQHLALPLARFDRTHQPGRTGADDEDVNRSRDR